MSINPKMNLITTNKNDHEITLQKKIKQEKKISENYTTNYILNPCFFICKKIANIILEIQDFKDNI